MALLFAESCRVYEARENKDVRPLALARDLCNSVSPQLPCAGSGLLYAQLWYFSKNIF